MAALPRPIPIAVDGIEGFLETAGTGPPVIVLASPLARGRSYRPLLRALAIRHRAFVVEMPSRLPGVWSVVDYAAWVSEALARFAPADIALIGHSYSGAVALLAAARRPTAVKRLVIADSIGFGGPHPIRDVVAGALRDLWLERRLVARAGPDVVGNLVQHPRRFLRLVRECLTLDVSDIAARVPMPVLVAWGRKDFTLPLRRAAPMLRHLPGARSYESTDGSHAWIISRAEEFAGVVAQLVRDAGANQPLLG